MTKKYVSSKIQIKPHAHFFKKLLKKKKKKDQGYFFNGSCENYRFRPCFNSLC